ncbi:MAG TPA: phenylalanine--tRNA ligase subunit beta [Candidatus Dormibacteraeota bacterium]|jgi:phenylalanyl-tRNA synthetase beta chain|nr:phenylalanine--tRNA ligase subunit beta [Candidatus Dormibacteraeota bacterium]
MKTSVQWMRDYAELDAPLDELAQALVDTGTEVNEVHRLAEGVVVARVLELDKVPESTKGVLFAGIEVAGGETVRVLTGAPNLRIGDLVPYAPPGVLLPGWEKPLEVRAMFGGKYHSPGMLCSAVELAVGDDADGILVLDHGTPGQAVHEVLALDAVMDIEVTPNRPDCLCHLGIARELAAALHETLREPRYEVPEALVSVTPVEGRASVRVEDPSGCPRFMVRVIEDVVVRDSPAWMQRRLRAIGLRPINNIVDVTNYVAAELGQPLHAFDYDRFVAAAGGGGGADVVVRRARDGEKLATLDGVERTLTGDDMVVCSGDLPVSLAGVMGGAGTAVDGKTKTVLLEAASWDGPTIRATSRRLALRSDASSHYEKGLSDTLPPRAIDRAAGLLAELASGRVLRGSLDEHPRPLPEIAPIEVPAGLLERVLGMHIDASEAAEALARLGFAVEQDGGALTVAPPHFRRDVSIPVDVAEEVGRSLGYARLPSTLPGRRSPIRALAPATPLEDRVRDVATGAGFDEAITFSFQSPALASRITGVGEERTPIRLRNPLSEDGSVMRISVLPGLLQALAGNLNRGVADVSLFEVGRVFWEGERTHAPLGTTPDGKDSALTPLPAEPLLLSLVSQTGDTGGEFAAARLRHIQSVLAWLSHELAGASLAVEPVTVNGLRPGRSGRLRIDGHDVGVLGELNAELLDAFELRGRVAVAELRLDAVAPEAPRVPRFRTPPRMPAVVQDLAVVVDASARADQALAAIREAGGPLLESAELYDEFRGERLGAGRKSWTFRMTYRAADRTLTSAEAQQVHEAIALALRVRVGGEVRR